VGTGPSQQFASDSSSPVLQAAATEAIAGVFSAFSAQLEISSGHSPGFELNAKFSLAASSNGISPVAEEVTLQIGTLWEIVPPGSFVAKNNGTFAFEGVINGVKLEVQIKPLGNYRFTLKADGGVNPTALTNHVNVALTIGNDTGLTAVAAEHD